MDWTNNDSGSILPGTLEIVFSWINPNKSLKLLSQHLPVLFCTHTILEYRTLIHGLMSTGNVMYPAALLVCLAYLMVRELVAFLILLDQINRYQSALSAKPPCVSEIFKPSRCTRTRQQRSVQYAHEEGCQFNLIEPWALAVPVSYLSDHLPSWKPDN